MERGNSFDGVSPRGVGSKVVGVVGLPAGTVMTVSVALGPGLGLQGGRSLNPHVTNRASLSRAAVAAPGARKVKKMCAKVCAGGGAQLS